MQRHAYRASGSSGDPTSGVHVWGVGIRRVLVEVIHYVQIYLAGWDDFGVSGGVRVPRQDNAHDRRWDEFLQLVEARRKMKAKQRSMGVVHVNVVHQPCEVSRERNCCCCSVREMGRLRRLGYCVCVLNDQGRAVFHIHRGGLEAVAAVRVACLLQGSVGCGFVKVVDSRSVLERIHERVVLPEAVQAAPDPPVVVSPPVFSRPVVGPELVDLCTHIGF